MTEHDDLLARLEAMYPHRGDGLPTQFVNPDGPEAAREIRTLQAQLAEAKQGVEFYSGRYAERCGQLAMAQSELAEAKAEIERLCEQADSAFDRGFWEGSHD